MGGATAHDGRARSAVRGGVVWAAARSGAVVLCMSGVNATVTIEALLLPGLFILTYARGRRLVSLAVCWGAAVAMATAWWALPLLLQGKYAFNFLPYVEQASTTTRAPSRPPPRCAARATGPPTSTSARRGCPRAGPW